MSALCCPAKDPLKVSDGPMSNATSAHNGAGVKTRKYFGGHASDGQDDDNRCKKETKVNILQLC